VRVHPSEANYLLAEVTGRDRLYEALFREGIVVRRRSEPRLKNFLRFTIGTEEENAKVISILEKVNLP
jgi:histidinol-phosphate aminotransferase